MRLLNVVPLATHRLESKTLVSLISVIDGRICQLIHFVQWRNQRGSGGSLEPPPCLPFFFKYPMKIK